MSLLDDPIVMEILLLCRNVSASSPGDQKRLRAILARGAPTRRLKEARVGLNHWDKLKFNCLVEALITKNQVAADILVEQPDFDVNMRSTASLQTTYNGKAVESGMIFYSVLDIAVATGYAVERILSLPGVKVNVKGWGGGYTPLMAAVVFGMVGVVEIFADLDLDWDLNFDLETRNDAGRSLEEEARRGGSEQHLQILDILDQLRCRRATWAQQLRDDQLMAEIEMDKLDLDDFEEKKPKMGAGKGRNARRRKSKMQAAAKRPGNEKSSGGKGNRAESVEKVKVDPKPESGPDEGQIAEKTKLLRMKLSQLEREERVEKDAFSKLEEEMKDLETAMEMLMKRKVSGSKKSKANEKKMAKVEMDKKAQKKSLAAKTSMEKMAKIQDEIKTVKQELRAAESGGKRMSKDLEAFLEREIADLEDELECPVCLEVANVAPIYKCEDDHLICRFQRKINRI